MKKGFLRSFCRTTKLIALRLVAGQGTKTTEEKIVFRKNYWHFLLSFKALVAHHTRIIGFISYWYCNTLARNSKKPQTFKNSLHFEFKNLSVPRQRVDTTKREMFSQKCQAIRRWFVSIRHGRHVLSQCPKERHFPPVLVPFFNISGGWMPLFRALAKNMAPMTNADESPTNRLTIFPIYLSLFIVSTLWPRAKHYSWDPRKPI